MIKLILFFILLIAILKLKPALLKIMKHNQLSRLSEQLAMELALFKMQEERLYKKLQSTVKYRVFLEGEEVDGVDLSKKIAQSRYYYLSSLDTDNNIIYFSETPDKILKILELVEGECKEGI